MPSLSLMGEGILEHFLQAHVVVLLNVNVAGDMWASVQNPLFLNVALCYQQDLVWALHWGCGSHASGGDLWEALGSELVPVW